MDRDAIARGARRREVLEALTFEREREAVLLDQIETVVLEEELPRIDRAARALLTPVEMALLDDIVGEPLEYDNPPDESDPDDEVIDTADEESEIERLQREVDNARARQRALEHLADLLSDPLPESVEPEAAR